MPQEQRYRIIIEGVVTLQSVTYTDVVENEIYTPAFRDVLKLAFDDKKRVKTKDWATRYRFYRDPERKHLTSLNIQITDLDN